MPAVPVRTWFRQLEKEAQLLDNFLIELGYE
jgi:hypothetical protein